MQITLGKNHQSNAFDEAISPLWEIAAYEALWKSGTASFKKLADFFAENPGRRPSDLIEDEEIKKFKEIIKELIKGEGAIGKPSLLINNTVNYPKKLRDAKEPVELLYYAGDYNLIDTRSVAIVGTRNPTEEGLKRTRKLVNHLVKDNVTIVSGLAQGIDTMAHVSTIEGGGKTIAVIGTPLNQYYPKQNQKLQDQIALDHLLISQVPYWKYSQQGPNGNRLFFPERNKTMSALTEATIIVEAGETSGTLIQARAALHQKRKLFILDSCFNNLKITWPKRFEDQGAIRVKDYSDIKNELKL